jgi:hypothetical protein
MFLVSMPITTADAVLEFIIPERTEIALSTSVVDLGTPRGNRQLYYEQVDAVRVEYRCNSASEWEVRISGTDFHSVDRTIPINRLKWRADQGPYREMPPSGSYTVLARKRDYNKGIGLKHTKTISYRLDLAGDEWGGTYTAPITYTLIVL